jgi:hypothetical protein
VAGRCWRCRPLRCALCPGMLLGVSPCVARAGYNRYGRWLALLCCYIAPGSELERNGSVGDARVGQRVQRVQPVCLCACVYVCPSRATCTAVDHYHTRPAQPGGQAGRQACASRSSSRLTAAPPHRSAASPQRRLTAAPPHRTGREDQAPPRRTPRQTQLPQPRTPQPRRSCRHSLPLGSRAALGWFWLALAHASLPASGRPAAAAGDDPGVVRVQEQLGSWAAQAARPAPADRGPGPGGCRAARAGVGAQVLGGGLGLLGCWAGGPTPL